MAMQAGVQTSKVLILLGAEKLGAALVLSALLTRQVIENMSRVYVGNLDPRVTEHELEDEFRVYGVIRSVWVARRPPGYAFLDFEDPRDARDAIRDLDGKNGWRVEQSHNRGGAGGGGHGGDCVSTARMVRKFRISFGYLNMNHLISLFIAKTYFPRFKQEKNVCYGACASKELKEYTMFFYLLELSFKV